MDEFSQSLAGVENFAAEPLNQWLHQFCESKEIKIGQIIHALRVAITGKAAGFGMFETMEILGRERTVRRIGLALQRLSQSSG